MSGHSPRRQEGSAEPQAPVVVNGWTVLVWTEFADRLTILSRGVARLRERDPEGYRAHPLAKLFRNLLEIALKKVPEDPNAPRYRQGNKLGAGYRGWHRAKFNQRFRLFFRFSTQQKVIVYGWLNDEATLRKEGARTDAYAVFRKMLARGQPPNEWDALVAASSAFSLPDAL